MIISAEKVLKFVEENKANNVSIENAIITAALSGQTSLFWTKELSKAALYDIIASGYDIREINSRGQICYDISWEKATEWSE